MSYIEFNNVIREAVVGIITGIICSLIVSIIVFIFIKDINLVVFFSLILILSIITTNKNNIVIAPT